MGILYHEGYGRLREDKEKIRGVCMFSSIRDTVRDREMMRTIFCLAWPTAVSYTHLDVYKRQLPGAARKGADGFV